MSMMDKSKRFKPGFKQERLADQRLSTCTDCKFGIFTDHIYHWTSRGLVHTECDNEVKNAT